MYQHPPIITLRTILITGLILGVGGVSAAYALYQARFLITGPIIVLEPATDVATNARVVELRGRATNITRLWLNDRTIYTDETGYFTEALVLETGYTIATLRAEDRYGRVTRLAREFVFKPQTFIE